MNHSNHNKYNERLEREIIVKDDKEFEEMEESMNEKKLEEIIKSMKLRGKSHEQICQYLCKKAGQYLKFFDEYCNKEECDQYRREE